MTATLAATISAPKPNTLGRISNVDCTNTPPNQWGRVVARDARGRPSKYELDFGSGNKIVTFVYWAD